MRRPFISSADVLLFAALLYAAAMAVFSPERGLLYNFGYFHRSAVAWLNGEPLYRFENLNPPIFIVVTSPIGYLSPPIAWVLWQAASALAFLSSIWLARRRSGAATLYSTTLVTAVHASTAAQLLLGQVAWLLTLPLTLGWLKARNQRFVAAGAWLGLVVAIKPFLLPMLLCSGTDDRWRRISASAVGTAGGLHLVGLAIVGPAVYGDWLRTGVNAWHLTDQALLASLTGSLFRWGLSSTASSVIAMAFVWVPLAAVWNRLDMDAQ